MNMIISRTLSIIALSLTLLLSQAGIIQAAGTLTLGAVGNNPQKEVSAYTPLMKYLENQLGVTTNIVVFENSDQLSTAIVAKKVDFFLDSPLPAAKVCNKSHARFLLRQWKGGIAEYNGIIAVRTGTANSIADLKGQMISFEDKDSTSSYLLPKLMLKQAKLTLVEKGSFRDKVGANEVGYVFSGDDANSIMWLDKEKVFAAGTKKERIAGKPEFKIIAESPIVPRSVVCVAEHLTGEKAQGLEKTLRNMGSDNLAQDALVALGKTTRFDAFPQGAEATQRAMGNIVETLGY